MFESSSEATSQDTNTNTNTNTNTQTLDPNHSQKQNQNMEQNKNEIQNQNENKNENESQITTWVKGSDLAGMDDRDREESQGPALRLSQLSSQLKAQSIRFPYRIFSLIHLFFNYIYFFFHICVSCYIFQFLLPFSLVLLFSYQYFYL